MNVRNSLLVILIPLAFVGRAETQSGDLTAAVRAAGLSPTVSSVPATGQAGSCATAGLFDGIASIADAGYPSAGQRFFFQKTASATFTLDYAVPVAFAAGGDVVVNGIAFSVGKANAAGTSEFTNYGKRMPQAWTLSGSDDGETWTTLVTIDDFTEYAFSTESGRGDEYTGRLSFANWKSFRRYRLNVTANTGDATMLVQLTEVRLFGSWGGVIVPPDPMCVDLTAAVRAAGAAPTLDANLTPVNASLTLDKAFNGTATSAATDRFIATLDSTRTALESADKAWISYSFPKRFQYGADVIVTGYTLDTEVNQGGSGTHYAFLRMPKSWDFQAYDETRGTWVTLDSYTNFRLWERPTVDDAEQHACTFSFTNSVPYRQYRLVVKDLNTSAPAVRQVQLSEIRLHGFVGPELAGKVGKTAAGHALDITATGRVATEDGNPAFTPVFGASACESVLAGTSTANLFDGIYKANWVLYTIGDNFPFVLTYEVPTDAMPEADLIVTGYSLNARCADVTNYDKRMPKGWSLEGWLDAESRWVVLDRKSGYASWQTGDCGEGAVTPYRYYADFSLADNRFAFRKYRLRVSSVNDLTSGKAQLALSEITLTGVWGKSLAMPVPPVAGLILYLH